MSKITIDRAVVEQALEALEDLRVWHVKQSMAVTALRAELAEPQEPVAWQVSADFIKWRGVPNHTTPPQPPAEPAQEPDSGGKTGWPPGLLQDDCRGLSKWLASRPDARQRLREALAEPVSVADLQAALVETDLIDPDALFDPDGYDAGSTVAQIDELHRLLFQRPAEPQKPAIPWGKAIGVEQKRGCRVCGIGADGKAYGYVCSRSDCPTRVTCGGAA